MRFKLIPDIRIVFLYFLFPITFIYGQEEIDTLVNIRQNFESFQYEKVIRETDSLLQYKNDLSTGLILELYRMKGIAHFSLLEDRLAENSFIEILKIDSTFSLDSAKTSPKIISFFNEVGTEFRQRREEIQFFGTRVDTVYETRIVPDREQVENIKNAYLRSLILPGWGHLYKDETTKGWVLTSLSLLSLTSSLYFIFDTINKEDDYMNETNVALIPDKYNKYNSSYKFRNYSLTAFAVIWFYTQIDILLFSEDAVQEQNGAVLNFHSIYGLQLRYQFSF